MSEVECECGHEANEHFGINGCLSGQQLSPAVDKPRRVCPCPKSDAEVLRAEIVGRDQRIEFLLVQHQDFRDIIEKQKAEIERLRAECNGEREAKEVYKRGEDLLFEHLAAEQRTKDER